MVGRMEWFAFETNVLAIDLQSNWLIVLTYMRYTYINHCSSVVFFPLVLSTCMYAGPQLKATKHFDG